MYEKGQREKMMQSHSGLFSLIASDQLDLQLGPSIGRIETDTRPSPGRPILSPKVQGFKKSLSPAGWAWPIFLKPGQNGIGIGEKLPSPLRLRRTHC